EKMGPMSQRTQAKVLRVLQEQEVERLGSARTIKVDVRVIAATNKHLEEALARGEFRELFFSRLNATPIVVPPLRERREHIPRLVQHFAKRTAEEHNLKPKRFDPSAMDALQRYRWRGNIRELRNTVERVLIMAPSEFVRVEDLPAEIRSAELPRVAPEPETAVAKSNETTAPGAGTLREFKDAAERAYLVQKLRENNWNISRTAELIDTPRSNLYKKLEQYGIKQEVDGEPFPVPCSRFRVRVQVRVRGLSFTVRSSQSVSRVRDNRIVAVSQTIARFRTSVLPRGRPPQT